MSHFKVGRRGLEVSFTPEEVVFLGDVIPLLADVGEPGNDPAATRLAVPVYLDDPDSNNEWWRLMGEDLNAGKAADRIVFKRVLSPEVDVITLDEGEAFLRVLNEARLVLGARMGVEIEEDHERLPEESRQVLDYLGWILEDLTTALSAAL